VSDDVKGAVEWNLDQAGSLRAVYMTTRACVWYDAFGDAGPDEPPAPGWRLVVEVSAGEEWSCVTHGLVHVEPDVFLPPMRDAVRQAAARVACAMCTAAMAVFHGQLERLAAAARAAVGAEDDSDEEDDGSPVVH
jgi:hypothetical protein